MRLAISATIGLMLAACGATAEWPPRTVQVAVKAPNPCWQIRITAIYRAQDHLLAVSWLEPPDPGQMCAQVISTLKHSVTLPLPDMPVTHLIVGRKWDWDRKQRPDYEYLDSPSALEQRIQGAERLYGAGEPESGDGGAVD